MHKSTIPDVHEDIIIESRNAVFFEDIFPCQERKEVGSRKTYKTANYNHQSDKEPRRSKRTKITKTFGPDFLTYMLENELRKITQTLSNPEAPF